MEEVRDMFKKLQADVIETKAAMKDMEKNITKNINNTLNEVIGNMQIKMQQIEAVNEAQERRLDLIERTQRQRNIVIFGVEEEEQSYNELTQNILNILNNIMNVRCTVLELQALRRIGKKGARTRPIAITLTTLGRKIEILKQWKTLKNTKYSIAEDYPPKILEIRKTLLEKAKIEKENGNKVIIKYDKLIVLPQTREDTEIQGKRNNKRALSQTPPQAHQKDTKKASTANIQVQKKNTISSYWTTARPTTTTAAEDRNCNQQ